MADKFTVDMARETGGTWVARSPTIGFLAKHDSSYEMACCLAHQELESRGHDSFEIEFRVFDAKDRAIVSSIRGVDAGKIVDAYHDEIFSAAKHAARQQAEPFLDARDRVLEKFADDDLVLDPGQLLFTIILEMLQFSSLSYLGTAGILMHIANEHPPYIDTLNAIVKAYLRSSGGVDRSIKNQVDMLAGLCGVENGRPLVAFGYGMALEDVCTQAREKFLNNMKEV